MDLHIQTFNSELFDKSDSPQIDAIAQNNKRALELKSRNAKIVCGDCNFTNIADQVKAI